MQSISVTPLYRVIEKNGHSTNKLILHQLLFYFSLVKNKPSLEVVRCDYSSESDSSSGITKKLSHYFPSLLI